MADEMVRFEDCGSYACITLNRPEKRNALTAPRRRSCRRSSRVRRPLPAAIITGAGVRSARASISRASRAPQRAMRRGILAPGPYLDRDDRGDPQAPVGHHRRGERRRARRRRLAHQRLRPRDRGRGRARSACPRSRVAAYPTIAGPSTQLRILRKHASWMILTGKRIDGRTAARWGLVNVAVPAARRDGRSAGARRSTSRSSTR